MDTRKKTILSGLAVAFAAVALFPVHQEFNGRVRGWTGKNEPISGPAIHMASVTILPDGEPDLQANRQRINVSNLNLSVDSASWMTSDSKIYDDHHPAGEGSVMDQTVSAEANTPLALFAWDRLRGIEPPVDKIKLSP